ncbi:hypothetical protein POW75_26050, partial [Klebsiella pneumoniae]
TVCVVGKMRDLILQLSKSSIYSTKPSGYCAWDVMVPLILRKYFVRVAMLSQVGKLKRRQTWG